MAFVTIHDGVAFGGLALINFEENHVSGGSVRFGILAEYRGTSDRIEADTTRRRLVCVKVKLLYLHIHGFATNSGDLVDSLLQLRLAQRR